MLVLFFWSSILLHAGSLLRLHLLQLVRLLHRHQVCAQFITACKPNGGGEPRALDRVAVWKNLVRFPDPPYFQVSRGTRLGKTKKPENTPTIGNLGEFASPSLVKSDVEITPTSSFSLRLVQGCTWAARWTGAPSSFRTSALSTSLHSPGFEVEGLCTLQEKSSGNNFQCLLLSLSPVLRYIYREMQTIC